MIHAMMQAFLTRKLILTSIRRSAMCSMLMGVQAIFIPLIGAEIPHPDVCIIATGEEGVFILKLHVQYTCTNLVFLTQLTDYAGSKSNIRYCNIFLLKTSKAYLVSDCLMFHHFFALVHVYTMY